MTHKLTPTEELALKELEADKKALVREAVLMRIEKRRAAEKARKNKEYTQERLEAEEKALKSIKRWLRRHNKKSLNLQKLFQNIDR